MKRDFDLIRILLLRLEEADSGSGDWVNVDDLCSDELKLYSHLQLMLKAGLIEGADRGFIGSHAILPRSITWDGHDFLDSVRDPEIWKQTKEGAKAVGGLTFELIGALAKGLVKTQIKKHTGVEIYRF